MADFAPTATCRYAARYTVLGRTHTIMVRVARTASAATIIAAGTTALFDLFSALASILGDDFAWIDAAYYFEDSEVSHPCPTPAVVLGLGDSTTASKQDSIGHLSFAGRGNLGSKASLHVYGTLQAPDQVAGASTDFVFDPGESAPVDAAVASLVASTDLVAIDNSPITWKTRVTYKINDYWLRKVRAGA